MLRFFAIVFLLAAAPVSADKFYPAFLPKCSVLLTYWSAPETLKPDMAQRMSDYSTGLKAVIDSFEVEFFLFQSAFRRSCHHDKKGMLWATASAMESVKGHVVVQGIPLRDGSK